MINIELSVHLYNNDSYSRIKNEETKAFQFKNNEYKINLILSVFTNKTTTKNVLFSITQDKIKYITTKLYLIWNNNRKTFKLMN